MEDADLKNVRGILADWWREKDGSADLPQVHFWTKEVEKEVAGGEGSRARKHLVAEKDGAVCGVVGYQMEPHKLIAAVAQSKKPLEVYMLFVKKESERQGIGRALLLEVEKYAREHDFKEVVLNSSDRWMDSWGFYEKMDYQRLLDRPQTHGGTAAVYSKLI